MKLHEVIQQPSQVDKPVSKKTRGAEWASAEQELERLLKRINDASRADESASSGEHMKLNDIVTEEKAAKTAAARVYHRDYLKTRKKPYRKYKPEDYKKRIKESVDDIVADILCDAIDESFAMFAPPYQSPSDPVNNQTLAVRGDLVQLIRADRKEQLRIKECDSLESAAKHIRSLMVDKVAAAKDADAPLLDDIANAVARTYWNK